MQFFLLFFLLLSPLRQVESLNIQINTDQKTIFSNYSNDNFKQILKFKEDKVLINTENTNFFQLDLNFRIRPDDLYIKTLSKKLKGSVHLMINGCYTLKDYMINISKFLKNKITYSDEKIPQDPETVIINGRAHCVGFSELTKVFLKGIGVKTRFIQGFYLKKKDDYIIPIPHRWIEIELSNGYLYFYDPQYQKFSSNYVVVNNAVIFSKIKKFKIKLINYSKKIIN